MINSIHIAISYTPTNLKFKKKQKTPQCSTSALYLDILLKSYARTKLSMIYDKRNDLKFSIVKSPYL
jgi:hypothetical protein